jgi:hypothetical protein
MNRFVSEDTVFTLIISLNKFLSVNRTVLIDFGEFCNDLIANGSFWSADFIQKKKKRRNN